MNRERQQEVATPDLTGRTLGRYEIVAKLGAGGMGEVYRARDNRLKREVALKVLPQKWLADAGRKRRFEHEARAASALNHPNIVTIHDIDQIDGVNVIAMECVAGKTLDQLIPRRGMPVQEALRYAIEIAGALAAAHRAGIVHRDIKPSNIMIADTGQVKVLDFGLAKLAEPAVASEEAPTVTLKPETGEGVIVGTVSYMSPEQAQGKPVDARSDIFSFGSMLYEMVTGQKAFRGDTKMSTLAAIVNQEPLPLGAVVPHDLEKVITRCLRKDPARRFQHMDDVQIPIQELKEASDSGELVPLPPTVRPYRRPWLWVAAVALAVAIVGAVWRYRGTGTGLPPMELVPLNGYAGFEIYPSFSPDGNQVVFSWDGEKQDNLDIYVQLIGSPTPLRLTTNPAVDVSPAFSPDGRSIGFIRFLEKRAVFVIVPAIGGPERIVADVLAPYLNNHNFWDFSWLNPGPLFSWLPDGKHVVTDGLTLLSVETGEAHSLTSPPPNVAPDISPAVSPDGHTIAFGRSSGFQMSELYLLALGADLSPKGDPRRLTSLKRLSHSPVWTPDGRKIIFNSGQIKAPGLWRVSVSGSTAPERLPIQGAWTPAISRTGNRLVYTLAVGNRQIWRLSLSDSGRPVGPPAGFLRPASSTRENSVPQYSPNGRRVAFASDRSGKPGIWVCDADGSNSVELFSQAGVHSGSPRWAPDGERLAFDSNAAGKMDIYIIRASGGNPVRLTADTAEDFEPSWSADGKWVYFMSTRSGRIEVWKAPSGGGKAVQVTTNGGWGALESRDGKILYYTKPGEAPFGVWKMPVGGGEETRVIRSVVNRDFEVVNDGIYFVEEAGGKRSIWFLAFATGKARIIAPIPSVDDGGFSASPDGRSFLFEHLSESGCDLMLVENFQP